MLRRRGSRYSLRANLAVPMIGSEKLVWGVWVSVSEESFRRATELWEEEGRESEMPCFGWIGTALPGHPETVGVKSRPSTRPVGLLPTEHPLSGEQQHGIAWQRVQEIAKTVIRQQP